MGDKQMKLRNLTHDFHISWKENINTPSLFTFEDSIGSFFFDFLSKNFLGHVKLLIFQVRKEQRLDAELNINPKSDTSCNNGRNVGFISISFPKCSLVFTNIWKNSCRLQTD